MNERGQISVIVVLSRARETSIPLEITAAIDEEYVETHVCSFVEPDEFTFGTEVEWIGGHSRFDPRAYINLLRLIRRKDADIIHIHPNASGSITRAVVSATDAAMVTTEHNDHSHFSRVKRVINGTTNPLNDVLIANSQATYDSLASWERALLRASGTEVNVIHNGVDIDTIKSAERRSNPPPLPDGFLVGTAGRLVPQKNQSALIRAVEPLIKATEDVHLILVGDGALRETLEELAANLGIAQSVHFLGYLPKRRDVYGVISELDIFSFPSQYEGFGVAVAEAMSLETTVMANDIPVLHEVIGNAGVFVDADRTEEFTDALWSLYIDDRQRAQLARRGARRIEQEYPLEKTVRKHIRLYWRLAGTSTTGNSQE